MPALGVVEDKALTGELLTTSVGSAEPSTSRDLSTTTDFGNCSPPALNTTSLTAACSRL